MYTKLFEFLDVNKDRRITRSDVDFGMRQWGHFDTTKNILIVNVTEWNKAVGGMFEDLCKNTMHYDRKGWMRRTAKKNTSKQNLFEVLDRNATDGELNREEYRFFYKNLDINGDI